MIVYVETSVAARLLVEEEASARLPEHLDALPDPPVSSLVLETELRTLAVRLDLAQTAVTTVPEQFDPLESDRALYREAGMLPGRHLRSLDAFARRRRPAVGRGHHGVLRPQTGRRRRGGRVPDARPVAGQPIPAAASPMSTSPDLGRPATSASGTQAALSLLPPTSSRSTPPTTSAV